MWVAVLPAPTFKANYKNKKAAYDQRLIVCFGGAQERTTGTPPDKAFVNFAVIFPVISPHFQADFIA